MKIAVIGAGTHPLVGEARRPETAQELSAVCLGFMKSGEITDRNLFPARLVTLNERAVPDQLVLLLDKVRRETAAARAGRTTISADHRRVPCRCRHGTLSGQPLLRSQG